MNLFGLGRGNVKPSSSGSGGSISKENEVKKIAMLKQKKELSEKRAEKIDSEYRQYLEEAKYWKSKKDIDKAKSKMKLALMKKDQREKIDAQNFNLELVINQVESALAMRDTAQAMNAGKSVLQSAVESIDADQIQETMGDIQETFDDVDIIHDAMGADLTGGKYDEELDEALNALDALEEDEIQGFQQGVQQPQSSHELPSTLPSVPATLPSAPMVPNTVFEAPIAAATAATATSSTKSKEDDELAALGAAFS